MKVYRINRQQFLPISVAEAWDFFSDPENLSIITPAAFQFEILAISGSKRMHAGQIIKYKVNALPLIRIGWVTEIGPVLEGEYFIDLQQKGPFAFWQHKHSFKAVDGGVEMTDEVEYAVPLGWLGRLAHTFFVKGKVNRTFDYRFSVLKDYFKEKD